MAESTSQKNKYISSATLNGRTLSAPFLSHEEIMAGGTLVLKMTDIPQKDVMTR